MNIHKSNERHYFNCNSHMTLTCSEQVLQSCHNFPRVLEIAVNSYVHLKPTTKWGAAIPDESYQVDTMSTEAALSYLNGGVFQDKSFPVSLSPQHHKEFYDSLFAVCTNTPRSLLHLARCAVRAGLRGSCHRGTSRLPLPAGVKKYLLLTPEGVLY